MSDEELVKRLRDTCRGGETCKCSLNEAADRIEALTAERDEHWKSFVHWRKEADALTEQLAAARQDAKFAEDELEMQEQEACMMENDYLKLEKERDALEAKLAKAVEIGNKMAHSIEGNYYLPNIAGEWRKVAAEIKGESHE